jgi:cob(I)alamin adenosyltransferase
MLSGNVNSLGDIDECLSVYNNKLRIYGKHCYVEVQASVNESTSYVNYLRKLIQSHEMIKSNLDDVSHQQLTDRK